MIKVNSHWGNSEILQVIFLIFSVLNKSKTQKKFFFFLMLFNVLKYLINKAMGRFLDRQFQWKNDNSYTIFFKDIYIIYVN